MYSRQEHFHRQCLCDPGKPRDSKTSRTKIEHQNGHSLVLGIIRLALNTCTYWSLLKWSDLGEPTFRGWPYWLQLMEGFMFCNIRIQRLTSIRHFLFSCRCYWHFSQSE